MGGPPTVSVVGAPDAECIEGTRRLLDAVGDVGPANAQFFLRDGELMVHDVNLRIPASVGLAIEGGVDVPALGVAAALGRPLPETGSLRTGLRYVSVGDEVRALLTRTVPGAPPAPRREVAVDIARAAVSRGAVLDPPLSDPLWIGGDLAAFARRVLRRERDSSAMGHQGPGRRGAVVVLWTGYRAGPWVVRSLRSAGWAVVPLQPAGSGSGRTTACRSPRPVPSAATDPDAFIAAVAQVCRETGARAVLPVDEDCVRVLAIHPADFGPARVIGPTAAQWDALCDKARLGETARAAGVAHPATTLVTGGVSVGPLPPLPSVVKVRGSDGPGWGHDVVRVATPAERDAALERLAAAGLDAVVQEFVGGAHHSVHCVRSADAFLAAAGRIIRTQPRRTGMPSILKVVGGDGPSVEAARRLLDEVGYLGPANVQFLARDGELLVHDVNLRPPAPVLMSMRAGVDLPALGVAAGLGLPLGPAPTVRPVHYVSLVDELRALRHVREAPPGSPSATRIIRDLWRAVASRETALDPPLRDPLWVASELRAHLPTGWARRAMRAMRSAPGSASV